MGSKQTEKKEEKGGGGWKGKGEIDEGWGVKNEGG